MPSNQPVSTRVLLEAVMELKRIGSGRALEKLEEAEPELGSYLMESLSDVHQQLLALGGRAKPSQRVFRDMRAICLVCISALRHSADEPIVED
jgi:hypothetical protein